MSVGRVLLSRWHAACHGPQSLTAGAPLVLTAPARGLASRLTATDVSPWWLDLIRARADDMVVGMSPAGLCKCSPLWLLLLTTGVSARSLVGGLKKNTRVVKLATSIKDTFSPNTASWVWARQSVTSRLDWCLSWWHNTIWHLACCDLLSPSSRSLGRILVFIYACAELI